MAKDELQAKIGVKIADKEFLYLKQYENENGTAILQYLANYRYLLLQDMENKILETVGMLEKLRQFLSL